MKQKAFTAFKYLAFGKKCKKANAKNLFPNWSTHTRKVSARQLIIEKKFCQVSKTKRPQILLVQETC